MTLDSYISEVEQELNHFIGSEDASSNEVKLFLNRIKQVTSKGKRFRPSLFFLTCQAYQAKVIPVSIGLSLELLHEALLIHDDLIDQDLVRHGALNVTGLYQKDKNYKGTNIPKSISLLAGDLLLTSASDPIINDPKLSNPAKLDCLRQISETIRTCIHGQLLDSLNINGQLSLDSESLDNIYASKTASYSCQLPMRLVSALVDISRTELKHIDNFAYALGIYLQSLNDHSDYFITKSFKDLALGKITRPYLIAIEILSSKDKKILTDYLTQEKLNQTDKDKIVNLLKHYNIRSASEDRLTDCRQKVVDALNKLNINKKANLKLLALVDSLKV